MANANLARGTQASLSRSQSPGTQQSTPTPPASAAASPASTAMDRETAIASIRANCELQIEYLQVMTDAVMLAVIQTQSVSTMQLATTSKAKQASVSEAFLDIAIALIGEGVGSLIESAAKNFFQEFATGILSTNTAFKVLPLSAEGQQLSGGTIDQALAAIASTKENSVDGGAWALYSENVRTVIEKGSDKLGQALGQAASQQLEKLAPKEPSNVVGTDQPGTAITRVVQAYVAAHRLALRTECVNLEAFIRTQTGITQQQLSTLVGSFSVNPPPAGMNSLRNNFALQVEGLIWAKLYNLAQYNAGGSENPIPPGASHFDGSLPNVPDAITHYWWQRFGPKIDPDVTNSYVRSLNVYRWMVTMEQSMDQMVQQIGASSSGITPYDPQPWPPTSQ